MTITVKTGNVTENGKITTGKLTKEQKEILVRNFSIKKKNSCIS